MSENYLNVEFAEKLRSLMDEFSVSKEDIQTMMRGLLKTEREQEIIQLCESHKNLVGRFFVKNCVTDNAMFPEMKMYYKVISERSSSPYHVECLIVPEKPVYWFEYARHKIGLPGDYYLGTFMFESFVTDSVLLKDIEQMREISGEDYTRAVVNYTAELLALDFEPDHYRYGGIFPTDDGWKVSDDEIKS